MATVDSYGVSLKDKSFNYLDIPRGLLTLLVYKQNCKQPIVLCSYRLVKRLFAEFCQLPLNSTKNVCKADPNCPRVCKQFPPTPGSSQGKLTKKKNTVELAQSATQRPYMLPILLP